MSDRILSAALAISLLGLAGCQEKISPHLEVLRQQSSLQKELTGLLRSVQDEATMKEAEVSLGDFAERSIAISAKTHAMLPPNPKTKEIIEKEADTFMAGQAELKKEIIRVMKLPGGEKFLQKFRNPQGP